MCWQVDAAEKSRSGSSGSIEITSSAIARAAAQRGRDARTITCVAFGEPELRLTGRSRPVGAHRDTDASRAPADASERGSPSAPFRLAGSQGGIALNVSSSISTPMMTDEAATIAIGMAASCAADDGRRPYVSTAIARSAVMAVPHDHEQPPAARRRSMSKRLRDPACHSSKNTSGVAAARLPWRATSRSSATFHQGGRAVGRAAASASSQRPADGRSRNRCER